MNRYPLEVTRELGQRICQMLGVDPASVLHVAIDWEPYHLPRAVVTMYLTEGAVRELFTLAPIDRTTMEEQP